MARKKGFILGIVDLVVLVLTLGAAVGLIFAYISPSVDPNRGWLFAYAGLAAPILYLANLFLMLYWAIRWKPLFFLPLIVLLIGTPKIKSYYHFGAEKAIETGAPGTIKVLTYNVEGFMQYNAETRRSASSARAIAGFIREQDPDIICLQEFQTTPGVPESAINDLLSDWPHRKIYYTITRRGQAGGYGSAIYSKYPIVRSDVLELEGNRKGSLWAEVLTPQKDTLRILCNHLESTYVRSDDLDFLQPENFANAADKSGQIRQIAGRLRRGFRVRAHQADTIAELIASRDVPTVVCGDFNDPPMSYAYKTIRAGYGDAFESKGSGYGYTYKKLYRLMRIDYILPSPHLETLSYESPDVPWSDHNPVVATLRMKAE